MPFVEKILYSSTSLNACVFLARELKIDMKEAQKILDKGRLSQDGRIISKGEKIFGQLRLSDFEAQKLDLEPVFANGDFCVYDKPHNLLIHPKGCFKHLSLNDALKARFGRIANPIHRLDAPTSGLVLCSLHKHSEKELKKLFANKQVKKIYRAIVKGVIEDSLSQDFLIDEPILNKHIKEDLGVRAIVSPLGKSAQTRLKVLKRFTDSTFVELIPLTGRTHQLRVHLAHINHPILGDKLYGVDDELARYFLENKVDEDEVCALLGVPYLLLNAYCLEFYYNSKRFCFYSKMTLDRFGGKVYARGFDDRR